MTSTIFVFGLMVVVLFGTTLATAVTPTAKEMEERDSWLAAKLQGSSTKDWKPELVVLANYDPIQRNGHGGEPLKIKETEFARGLFCHAPSKIVVRLPSPGKTFSSMAGIISVAGDRGSVKYTVYVRDKKVFQSDVRRGGMPALPVRVDLDGAMSFTIAIDNGGDGINFDQSCWADAKVTLANGDEVWLDELKETYAAAPYDRTPFFSFIYNGQPSAELLKGWKLQRGSRDLDASRTEHTLTYRDPKTQLVVRCVAVAWKEYPTVEWTVYFKNEGARDTPVLESIQALDTTFRRSETGEFLLHHHNGDGKLIDSFAPLKTILGPNVSKRFAPAGGRPTNLEWPYYALERPAEEEGVIVVIGWPGQWASQFIRDDDTALRVVAGQELTHLKLNPGEEMRTPLIVLQFYEGDRYRAQNIWRRWMFQHNFPKDRGKPLSPKHGAASVWYFDFQCTQAGDIEFINTFAEKGLPLDYWWMDAGWYPGGRWPVVGTWEPDKARFPDGLKAVTDTARKHGGRTIVWFEMERVHPGTWLTENHPGWIFGGAGGGLMKLHEPEVAKWVLERADKIMTENKIELYRIDFNIDPLNFWRGNDAPDRQGITENRYVTNFLWYLDELHRRHPGILMDSCASGGRRDDLETMRRAVPILRSDLENNPEAYQCFNYAFGLWLPFYDSTNYERFDKYYFRSTIAPFLQCNWDVRKADFDEEAARGSIKEWRTAAAYYFGDFWPITAYSTTNDVWIAWQFDRPDREDGLIQAFRRSDCPYVAARYKLQHLDADARYLVTDLDTNRPVQMTGRDLMENGLMITISDQPGAALFTYKKIN